MKKTTKLFFSVVFSLIFSLSFSAIFAQNSNILQTEKSIYEQIDTAFRDKKPDSVSNLLASYRLDKSYADYEEYVLQKTRALLLSNQLDLIQSMCLAIIDNNLDNQDAVNLYTTVEKSVAKRNARQKALEEQRKAEAEYVAQATQREKESIRKDYNTIENTTSGQTLFVAPVTSKYYSDFTWSMALNIAEIGYRLAKTSSINYGVGVSGDFYYRSEDFSLGTDFFIDTSVLNFNQADISMSEVSLTPGLAFTSLNEDFFFRLGFSQMKTTNEKSFITPTVGFSLKNIAFDNFRLGFYADYYLGHIFEDNMKTGFGAGLQSAFLLGNLGNVNLALFINFRESLFVLNDGIDSRSRITIGFGVENNE